VSQATGKLERRARTLLRAYPADYRHGRAEEIITTLLEAAPPGRSFPPAREAWSLIAGGRHARAARNRRPGIKANLRLALLLGISTYLSVYFGFSLVGNLLGFFPGDGTLWLTDARLAFCTAVALAPWLGSRAAVTALAIPAGALVAYDLSGDHGSMAIVSLAELLIVLAALAALSGGPARLPRSWLWLIGAFPLALVLGRLLSPQRVGPGLEAYLGLDALLLVTVIVVCWLVTDARPAFGLCVAYLLTGLLGSLPQLAYPGLPAYAGSLRIAMLTALLLQSALALPVLLPAAWLLLRRQETPGPRPYPEP
jgi:hypothetical protein